MKVEVLNHEIKVSDIAEKLMQRKVHKLKRKDPYARWSWGGNRYG